MISAKKALLAKGDKHALQSCCKQLVSCCFKGSIVGDLDAREHLGLKAIWLERVNLAQDLLELLCLDGRNGIAEDGAGHVLGNELDGLLRQVGINHASCGVLDNIQALLDALRGDILVNLHVIDGFLHLTVLVHNEEVGGSGSARHGNGSIDVNTAVQAAFFELARTIVLAKSGEQTNVAVEKGQVVGNISANATKGHGDLARV